MPTSPVAAASVALRHEDLLRITSPLRSLLAAAPYAPPEGSFTSVKSFLATLLPPPSQQPSADGAGKEALDLLLFCAAARAASAETPALHWVPEGLSKAAAGAMEEMAAAGGWGDASEMLLAMMPAAVPPLKAVLKETDVDAEDDMICADKPPKEHAFVAAHQFRWLLSQVNYPKLGDLCWLVIPCALTALDHWSPDVKEQGMVSFMHIAKNVKATELSLYEDAILDACCNNIPADDELWYRIVEVSVLLLTCTQRSDPRSPWYSKMLAEMLGHLERQPLNKERRVAWLSLIAPVFDAMGLFLLAHFRLLFSLFFQWMHADDDRTVLLVLERTHAVIKLTWIRQSPYISRLVDELVLLYKESATRKSREVMRNHIVGILVLLQKCKGQLFEEAWKKHEVDPDLTLLLSCLKELCTKDSSPKLSAETMVSLKRYIELRQYIKRKPRLSYLPGAKTATFTYVHLDTYRYQIALGVARGLSYLHDSCRDCIIHYDIKLENILLDDSFLPKIADFGMAKLLGRDYSRVLTTMKGTVGYIAPEWITGVASTPKVDVYSYGMVLLKIISSNSNLDVYFPVHAAHKLLEGDGRSLVDHILHGVINMDEAELACNVACWCIQDDELDQPTMGQVVQILQGLVEDAPDTEIAPSYGRKLVFNRLLNFLF